MRVYTPTQFREERPEVLAQAIREIQLATLITATGAGDYKASHLPMVLKRQDERFVLEGHLARPNEHWSVLRDGPRASLAVFQGPQAYVSPSWYESKRRHGKVVPTWNYIAVHAQGALGIVEDEAWLTGHLNDLTRANESGREHPWAVADAPEDFIRNLARGVVGLRLAVERIEGSWKMAQHRPEGDRLGAIAGLSASARPSDKAVAAVMRGLEAARAAEPPR
jgi:transcriptional regulator